MIVNDIQTREYLAVQGVLVVVAAMIIVINFIVDISYSLLDPRIRYT
jgi:ABC-type dipeptide/oligopeptide/nickel transport system permease component